MLCSGRSTGWIAITEFVVEMQDRLREETRNIEYRLHRAERYGLNPYEANGIQTRIARLEQRVQYASANRYGRYGRYGNNGGDGYGHHDERDGRWDHDQNDD